MTITLVINHNYTTRMTSLTAVESDGLKLSLVVAFQNCTFHLMHASKHSKECNINA